MLWKDSRSKGILEFLLKNRKIKCLKKYLKFFGISQAVQVQAETRGERESV